MKGEMPCRSPDLLAALKTDWSAQLMQLSFHLVAASHFINNFPLKGTYSWVQECYVCDM